MAGDGGASDIALAVDAHLGKTAQMLGRVLVQVSSSSTSRSMWKQWNFLSH